MKSIIGTICISLTIIIQTFASGSIANPLLYPSKSTLEVLDTFPKWFPNDPHIFHMEKKVGIGTFYALAKLSVFGNTGVEGNMRAFEFEATPNVWPDYVFKPDYDLMSLEDLEQYILKNKHLPKVPTEKEVLEKGNNLVATDILLLEKVEELMLHLIDLNTRIEGIESSLKN